jgi:NADP-dependent 3-hydroxy acid dehydrogenase YdfG
MISGAPTHLPLEIDGVVHKGNIGTATALALATAGATVQLIARDAKKLNSIAAWIADRVPGAVLEVVSLDVTDYDAVKKWAAQLPTDKELAWVQSVGLGAGNVQIRDDNPYLTIEELYPELIEAELSIIPATIRMLQCLLPHFRQQGQGQVVVVGSMSGVRSFWSGSIHNAAKGGLSRLVNGFMLELATERIFVSEVRPGAVDTGLYDSEVIQERIVQICLTYGYDWSQERGGLRLMSPLSVGEAVGMVLASEAHISEVSITSKGQMPHQGS